MAELRITLACSPAPGEVVERVLHLAPGATVADAIAAAGSWQGLGLEPPAADQALAGIWGRSAPLEQLLSDGDRVELYRPLTVDPKVARRERFARQGARAAGLFQRQRPGAKAGY
jgi:sulfur carrier protein